MKNAVSLASIFLIYSLNIVAQNSSRYGFESWSMVAVVGAPSYNDIGNNWNSLNSLTAAIGTYTCLQATATADVHSGASAVQLITKKIGRVIANGLLTTGTVDQATSSVFGGRAYSLRPDSIVGWYKCTPLGGDSGFMQALLLGAGGDTDTIGYGIFRTPSTAVNTYTRFAQKIEYRSSEPVVKSILMLSSSYDNFTHVENSILYVDDFQLGSEAFILSSIADINNAAITVGPNPSSGQITINNPNLSKGTFKVYDITGYNVKKERIANTATTINLENLSNGVYIYSILDENNKTLKTGELIIQK